MQLGPVRKRTRATLAPMSKNCHERSYPRGRTSGRCHASASSAKPHQRPDEWDQRGGGGGLLADAILRVSLDAPDLMKVRNRHSLARPAEVPSTERKLTKTRPLTSWMQTSTTVFQMANKCAEVVKVKMCATCWHTGLPLILNQVMRT